MKLTERLEKNGCFFDGGMGTILQAHGLKAGELPGNVEPVASG